MKEETMPLPAPDVRCGEYAGPPGEGASENLWDEDSVRAAMAQAVAAEREACALLMEQQHDWLTKTAGANLIRARSQA